MNKLFKLSVGILILITTQCAGQDTMNYKKKDVPYWHVERGDKVSYVVIRGTGLDSVQKEIPVLIDSLNASYHKYLPQIVFQSIKPDTVQITLEPERRYTNQLGSYGWLQYLLKIVFTLTEAENINYIDLKIEELGEHGKPGVFYREYFENDPAILIIE